MNASGPDLDAQLRAQASRLPPTATPDLAQRVLAGLAAAAQRPRPVPAPAVHRPSPLRVLIGGAALAAGITVAVMLLPGAPTSAPPRVVAHAAALPPGPALADAGMAVLDAPDALDREWAALAHDLGRGGHGLVSLLPPPIPARPH